jgi:hypothetical protein
LTTLHFPQATAEPAVVSRSTSGAQAALENPALNNKQQDKAETR